MMTPFAKQVTVDTRIPHRVNRVLVLVVIILLCLAISTIVNGQHKYHKDKARYYKSRYRSQISYYANACETLDKKKHQKPKSNPRLTFSKVKHKPMAEIDPPGTPRVYETEIASRSTETGTESEAAEASETIEILHRQEDVVLAENLLPVPTSEKHEEIRRVVAENLKSNKGGEPIELAPLYFTFNEDEFSVVDMEPFLVAVEYAIQGKHILIEGHTDSRGADAYNVQLSIKRVQKIRDLMHDMGVPDDRISVVGYGEEHASNAAVTDEGDHQNNRRVDFKVF